VGLGERMRDSSFGCRMVGGWVASVGLATAFMLALSSNAFSQAAPVAGPHVTAHLVAETRAIAPGRPLHLALRQQMQPGWHTYWSNPGESGLPTAIAWSLPQDFAAGPILWPAPERFMAGPVVGYGYKDEILLPITIDVPAGLQDGTEVVLAAHASWLACSDTCIPEEAEVSISLPVGAVAELDPAWAGAFAAARARTPRPNPFATTATVSKDAIILRVATGDASQLQNVVFLPADANVIDDGAPQSVVADGEGLMLLLQRDKSQAPPAALNGVLSFRDLAAQAGGAPAALSISASIGLSTHGADAGLGLITAVLFALIGGFVLNLMPCVLPVLSVKVLALVEHSELTPQEMRLQGIAYTAGVLASFAVIGSALLVLRAAGAEIGWGFQLQSPIFVTLMIYLVFAVGLNLSGVFSIGNGVARVGANLTSRPGYAGSFFTGVLATLVATPCTAPFMAAAVGFAITQPWYTSLAVLGSVGLGLALPYLVVSFIPRARALLPKPGIWMLRLREILAFPVYGTAVWLAYVLSQLTGSSGIAAALAGLVLIAFAAWIYEALGRSEGRRRAWRTGLSTLAVAAALALLVFIDDGAPSSSTSQAAPNGIEWQPFNQARLELLQSEGKPVFIDFTAAWCITCKLNERIAFADPAVVGAFMRGGVVALKADWTRRDADITRILEANGRAGVPLYLYYRKPGADGERQPPIVLPQLLTPTSILHEMQPD
jgi:thiol:disulfide interchange protein